MIQLVWRSSSNWAFQKLRFEKLKPEKSESENSTNNQCKLFQTDSLETCWALPWKLILRHNMSLRSWVICGNFSEMKNGVQNLEIYLCFACEMNRASASSWQRAGLGNLPEGGCEGERGERGGGWGDCGKSRDSTALPNTVHCSVLKVKCLHIFGHVILAEIFYNNSNSTTFYSN